jgi:NAD(P)-dependent dehydrogenase (short-subunit alcohol dehydrogenase family)
MHREVADMVGEGNGTRAAVVITGSSSGIGKSCALRLRSRGFHVFAGVRNEKDRDLLLQESKGTITPLFIDVASERSVAAAAEEVAGAVGSRGLAGLVNNAGIVVGGPLEFLPLDEVRKQFEVNVFGQIAVTKAFLPLLRRARGRIVNMSSIAGRASFPYIGPYSASKYALEAVSDAFRMELLPWGIPVSVIEPGDVATPIWDKSLAAAREIAEHFPAHARDLYGSAMDAAIRASEKAAAASFPPALVARAVEHAIIAKRPKTRYLVGRGVGFRAFLKTVLPDRMFDRLVVGYMGLPGTDTAE